MPERARWEQLKHTKQEVGAELMKAFAELEDKNLGSLEGVLKPIDFNKTFGKNNKRITDADLVELLGHFDRVDLTDDNLEFPDLLGSAYEYLIKYFADSAGKKGGEFYTPRTVVKLLVNILDPAEDAEVCDPAVGSGGMLIESYNYAESKYGSARKMTLYGQEKNGGTWGLCKLNMLFHGILDSQIENGDTLSDPRHLEGAELRRFDIVIANPPFSQNYSTEGMKFKDRYQFWMPTKGKADFMFVQHMFSSLKSSGRMAVIMPHGVLFRGGEERKMRAWMISHGYLEAVIGLPPALFYGTGIPASVLVLNRAGADKRKQVLFINADREYKEGKVQNLLRPEDIEKIGYVYHHRSEIEGYSRLVDAAELKKEEYNCNIRRYVDNSPPPENQDVRAHLKGGVPLSEVEALAGYWKNYVGLRDNFFGPGKGNYCRFAARIKAKDDISAILEASPEIASKHKKSAKSLSAWWEENLPHFEALPKKRNVYALYRLFSDTIGPRIGKLGILDEFESRGAFASYWSGIYTDLESVAASGWNAELIPDEEILESQFPEVLKELRDKEARRDELDAIFKEVAELEEGAWNEEDYEVFPKDELATLRASLKSLGGELKELESQIANAERRVKALDKAGQSTKAVEKELASSQSRAVELRAQISREEDRLARHAAFEAELKACKKVIREIKERKELLVEEARRRIGAEEAKALILARWKRSLYAVVDEYLARYSRGLRIKLESMWEKYHRPLKSILEERDRASEELAGYLRELGYE